MKSINLGTRLTSLVGAAFLTVMMLAGVDALAVSDARDVHACSSQAA